MRCLKDFIGQLYYTHGLFCASHPFATIFGVIVVASLACYPLLSVPLLVYAPLKYVTPIEDYVPPPRRQPETTDPSAVKSPRWYLDLPVGYVQQIIVKAAVVPWQPKRLVPIDAVRGSLGRVFEIYDFVNQFKLTEGSEELSVADLCMRVGETTRKQKPDSILPQYDCLILSPSRIWTNDRNRFHFDPSLLKTIYNQYGNQLEPPPSIQDLLFGVQWKRTGLSRYFIRNRQRPMTYAITIVFGRYHHQFVEKLKSRLISKYPDTLNNSNTSHTQHITHLHYRTVNYFVEYTPLIVTYIALFLYIYFSVHKIEMVKSKWGLAVSAVATVVVSLLVSVSICTLLGLTPSLRGAEIIPYLGILIGLENILVLTKSVMSTPQSLSVKNRLALGLQKEGWSITKNLAAEFFIILVGFCTFVPSFQEFCVFAGIGLFSDFCLQMFFFSTVLSIDIRRTEDLPMVRFHPVYKTTSQSMTSDTSISPLFRCPVMALLPRRAATPDPSPQHASDPPANDDDYGTFFQKLPKRLRFVFFWARTRIVQRAIMIVAIVWIVILVNKANIVEQIASYTTNNSSVSSSLNKSGLLGILGYMSDQAGLTGNDEIVMKKEYWGIRKEVISDDDAVRHTQYDTWTGLYDNHWIKLFGHYNVSLFGKYLSVLPSIHLSIKINPDEAISIRLPSESIPHTPDIPDNALDDPSSEFHRWFSSVESWWEMSLMVVVGILACLFLLCLVLIIINCVWTGRKRNEKFVRNKVTAAQTIILKGHEQDIECLVVHGINIVTSCLGGEIRVWNGTTGDCTTIISRSSTYAAGSSSNHIDLSRSFDTPDVGIMRRRHALYELMQSHPPPLARSHDNPYGGIENISCGGKKSKKYPPAATSKQSSAKDHRSESFDLTNTSKQTVENVGPCYATEPTPRRQRAHTLPIVSDLKSSPNTACAPTRQNYTQNYGRPIKQNETCGDDKASTVLPQKDSVHGIPDGSDSSLRNSQHCVGNIQSPSQSNSSMQISNQSPYKSDNFMQQAGQFSNLKHTINQSHECVSNASQSKIPAQTVGQSTSPIYTTYQSLQLVSSIQATRLPHNQSQTSSNQTHNIFTMMQKPIISPYINPPNQTYSRSINQNSSLAQAATHINPSHTRSSQDEIILNSPTQFTASFPTQIPASHRVCHASPSDNVFVTSPMQHYLPHASHDSTVNPPTCTVTFSNEETIEPAPSCVVQASRSSSYDEPEYVRLASVASTGEDICMESELELRCLDDANVWCLACQENLILAGCSNGRIEFWDATSGQLLCFHDGYEAGVTAAVFVRKTRVCVARLDGTVDFIYVDVTDPTPPRPDSPYASIVKGHSRHGSFASQASGSFKSTTDGASCVVEKRVRAHIHPITALVTDSGLVVSASHDKSIKILHPEDFIILHNLIVHSAPVTCVHLDAPLLLSGSKDTSVCVWQLANGQLMRRLLGNSGQVVSIVTSRSYIVSLCADQSLCVWGRRDFRHLRRLENTSFGSHNLALISDDIIVSGFLNEVCVASLGEQSVLHNIRMYCDDSTSQVEIVRALHGSTVVCSFGRHVAVINLPAMFTKSL